MTLTYFVHGYNFDIAGGEHPKHQFYYWRKFVKGPHQEFLWQSTPQGGLREAWASGSWNTYHWAWKKAIHAGDRLANYIVMHNPRYERVRIVCHSLGSRVAYHAMSQIPEWIEKILTLNGADSCAHAKQCLLKSYEKTPHVPQVYSVQTKADDVLDILGKTFTPTFGRETVVGFDPMVDPPPNWHEIMLTPKESDGPGWKDHSWSFKNEKLHSRWMNLLEGT